MSLPSHLPEKVLHGIPWNEEANAIWPASSFTLHRNVAQYLFPQKLTEKQSTELLAKLQKAFSSLSQDEAPLYIAGEVLSPQEKEMLAEYFLSPSGYQHISSRQAIVLDPAARFIATLNVEDHIQLQWVDCKGQWEQAWNLLSAIEGSLGELIDFAFSPKFGYLTADPSKSGTGLTVACYLHLPCLIHTKQLMQMLVTHKEPTVDTMGMLGNMDDLLGDFVILQNRYTLGVSEQTILRDLHATATKLILAERTLRQKYQTNASAEIKDAVSRAYGLLMHSYQLGAKESLDAISKIKLGISLGWVLGMQDHEINEIFFRSRKAHLQQSHQDSLLDRGELAHTRAEYLHAQLKQTTLSIGSVSHG